MASSLVHHIESEIGPLGNPQREFGIPMRFIKPVYKAEDCESG